MYEISPGVTTSLEISFCYLPYDEVKCRNTGSLLRVGTHIKENYLRRKEKVVLVIEEISTTL